MTLRTMPEFLCPKLLPEAASTWSRAQSSKFCRCPIENVGKSLDRIYSQNPARFLLVGFFAGAFFPVFFCFFWSERALMLALRFSCRPCCCFVTASARSPHALRDFSFFFSMRLMVFFNSFASSCCFSPAAIASSFDHVCRSSIERDCVERR